MRLDIAVRVQLLQRRPPCDTAEGLAARLEGKPRVEPEPDLEAIKRVLAKLLRNGNVTSEDGRYCHYITPPPSGPPGAGQPQYLLLQPHRSDPTKKRVVAKFDPADVPTAIRVDRELDVADKPLTTRALAQQVSASPGTVAKTCQGLEAGGFVSRGTPQTKTLYLSPLTGEVINPSNFDRNRQLLSSLRAVVSKYELEDKRLEVELRRSLDRLLQRRDLAKFRERIAQFRSRLLAAVRAAEKKTDIYAVLGLMPFEREVTTWVPTRPRGG